VGGWSARLLLDILVLVDWALLRILNTVLSWNSVNRVLTLWQLLLLRLLLLGSSWCASTRGGLLTRRSRGRV
jgi:hypothetical protein